MSDVNILLVDDDTRNLDALESILDSPEYRLIRARNAEEALLALMSGDFAVIMLDIRMPDMTGIELAQLIKQRKRTQRLPIIFLTAYYQEDEHVMQGYGVGAVDYISKPFNPAILRSKVEVFVDLYRKTRALESEIQERRQAELLVAQRTEELKSTNLALEQRSEQLARMASELTLAEQRERQRLAGLLHDHVQQLLVAASFKLHSISPEVADGAASTVGDIRNLLAECLKASRSLTVELSPPILHEGGLTQGLQWLVRGMHEKYGLEITLYADPQAVIGREDVRILLFQSVRELLFNAVKHAECKQVELSLKLLPEGDLSLAVHDDGAGFNPDHAFSRERDKSGGFGLFSIRERLTLLDGRLEIESSPGAGSTFTLLVPASCLQGPAPAEVATEKKTNGTTPVPAPELDESAGKVIRMLLVDDHKLMRQGLAHLLEAQPDIRIIGEASDGVEAVEQVRRAQPDVILMDSSMPRMDGVQTTQIIHQEYPEIKIIGLSMYDEADRAAKMREAGAVGYVTKSGDPAILLSTIRRHASVN